jgi:hypothetical protein
MSGHAHLAHRSTHQGAIERIITTSVWSAGSTDLIEMCGVVDPRNRLLAHRGRRSARNALMSPVVNPLAYRESTT